MDPTQASLRTARMIAAALPIGVVLFWIVGWVVTKGGTLGVAPQALAGDLALWIWSAAALLGFAGALFFRGRAVQVAEAAAGRPPSPATAGEVQATLIVAWALLEAPALLSGVFFLLFALTPILWAAVPVYLMGVAITFPRAEWFPGAE